MSVNLDFGAKKYVDDHMSPIGLGTYEIRSEKVIFDVLDAALDVGYRFIDTAQVYRNETFIGNALQVLLPKYNLKREDIFITSKLSPRNQGSEKCRKTVEQSLENLQTDYIDLFLIHWPGASSLSHNDERNIELRSQSWKCLEDFYYSGKLKSIGVSNYNVSHLEGLLANCAVSPAVNQCEYHPHYYQTDLVDFCKAHNIHFQAYSSFGGETNKDDVFRDERIKAMAAKYDTSITNFLLAWALCQGISVLPRSRNPQHVRDNFEARNIQISNEDIDAVKCAKIHKYSWDPEDIV